MNTVNKTEKIKPKNFEELKKILKSKLPEFLEMMGVKRSKTRRDMFHSFYPDTVDRNPSLHIFKSYDGDLLYHCFSTNRTGDIFTANYIINGYPIIGSEFITKNVKYLCELFDIEYDFKPLTPEEIEEINIRSIYGIVRDIIVSNLRLRKVTIDQRVLNYINEKGFDLNEDSLKYDLGYCHNYDDLMIQLEQYGIDRKQAQKYSIREYIFNPRNLIFVIHNEFKQVTGFAARNCYFDKSVEHGSKYYNIENNLVYKKSSVLYNIHNAIKKAPKNIPSLFITEGYTDAITLDKAGYRAVALGGTKFTNEHILLLQKVGMTDIVFLLDGDQAGKYNAAKAITETMENIRNFRARIAFLPDNEDPDSFIRKNGPNALASLQLITAFEFRLMQLKNNTDYDEHEIAKKIVPLIVNESSAIERDRMCKKVASMLDIPVSVIRQEVNNLVNSQITKFNAERDAIIDNAIKLLRKNPDDAVIIIKNTLDSLVDIMDKNAQNIYGIDEFVYELMINKDTKEIRKDNSYINYFRMPRFEKKMKGSTAGKLFLLGGQPNAGKSAWMINWVINVLRAHEGDQYYNQVADDNRFNDVSIFYHTIDDSRDEIIPRFVSALAFDLSHEVTINNMGAPYVYDNIKNIQNYDLLLSARAEAYRKLEEWAREGRLIIKDASIGATLSAGSMVLNMLREMYPNRHIIYIVDNLHNLRDFVNIDDEVKRIKEIATSIKQDILVPYGIMGFCTVEYKKGQADSRGSRILLNELLRESKALEYAANWIGHLVNEMHNDPTKTKMFFYNPYIPETARTEDDKYPIIRLIVTKNKVSSFKGELFYMLYSDKGVVREVTKRDLSNFPPETIQALLPYYYGNNVSVDDIINAHSEPSLNGKVLEHVTQTGIDIFGS